MPTHLQGPTMGSPARHQVGPRPPGYQGSHSANTLTATHPPGVWSPMQLSTIATDSGGPHHSTVHDTLPGVTLCILFTCCFGEAKHVNGAHCRVSCAAAVPALTPRVPSGPHEIGIRVRWPLRTCASQCIFSHNLFSPQHPRGLQEISLSEQL